MFASAYNPFFAGMCEECATDDRVMDCVRYIHSTYGDKVAMQDMEDSLDRYGIEYSILPRHLKAEFDYFDIVGE